MSRGSLSCTAGCLKFGESTSTSATIVTQFSTDCLKLMKDTCSLNFPMEVTEMSFLFLKCGHKPVFRTIFSLATLLEDFTLQKER